MSFSGTNHADRIIAFKRMIYIIIIILMLENVFRSQMAAREREIEIQWISIPGMYV